MYCNFFLLRCKWLEKIKMNEEKKSINRGGKNVYTLTSTSKYYFMSQGFICIESALFWAEEKKAKKIRGYLQNIEEDTYDDGDGDDDDYDDENGEMLMRCGKRLRNNWIITNQKHAHPMNNHDLNTQLVGCKSACSVLHFKLILLYIYVRMLVNVCVCVCVTFFSLILNLSFACCFFFISCYCIDYSRINMH